VTSPFVHGDFAQHDIKLRSYLKKRIRPQAGESVDEVAQLTWTRLLQVKDPERIKVPLAYLYATAASALADYRAERARHPLMASREDSEDEGSPKDGGDRNSLFDSILSLQMLEEILRNLSPLCREIIVMRSLHGFSDASIGKILGFSPRTIAVYHSRALAQARQLRDQLESAPKGADP